MAERFILVAGPFKTEREASSTADALGRKNHNVYSRYIDDAEGYTTNVKEYFVERDTEAQPELIFGRSWEQILELQRGPRR